MTRAGRVGLGAAMVLSALALGGCGRRGALEPPPDPAVAQEAAPADQPLAAVRRPKRVPIAPPDKPFVLDPLL